MPHSEAPFPPARPGDERAGAPGGRRAPDRRPGAHGRAPGLPAWPSQSFQTGAWGSAGLQASGTCGQSRKTSRSHTLGLRACRSPLLPPSTPWAASGCPGTTQQPLSIFSDIRGHRHQVALVWQPQLCLSAPAAEGPAGEQGWSPPPRKGPPEGASWLGAPLKAEARGGDGLAVGARPEARLPPVHPQRLLRDGGRHRRTAAPWRPGCRTALWRDSPGVPITALTPRAGHVPATARGPRQAAASGGALHLARLAAWADRRDSGFPSRPGHRPSPFRAPHHCCCHWGSGGSQPDESGPPGGVSRVAFHPDDGRHPANQRGGSHGGAAVCHVPSGRHSRPGVSVRGSPVSYAQLTRSENVARQSWK